MNALTLQTLLAGKWHDAGTLEFDKPEEGARGSCLFEYDFDYFPSRMEKNSPLARVSIQLPVEFGPTFFWRWPTFLDDIRPMGSARRWWLQKLNLRSDAVTDFELLRSATIAPIGNLRIKEAVPEKESAPPLRFARQAVIDREHGFLEFAADHGAQIGGATGAGGDAPKLLLRLTHDDNVWIDTWQDDPENADRHYLVKFSRGERTARDRDILRSEYAYYQVLTALGLETIATDGMHLEEGENGPSLWLPRFDVERDIDGGVERDEGLAVRLGVESIYSLLGAAPGAMLTHEAVLVVLKKVLPPAAWPASLLDYLQRDLLNQVFGNSDNHGRNIALLKTETSIRLAPIFDFAPMKMDPEGIIRTTKWKDFERGGRVQWNELFAAFGPLEDFLCAGMRALAQKLRDVPDLLRAHGLPEKTLAFPALGLQETETKLHTWGLL